MNSNEDKIKKKKTRMDRYKNIEEITKEYPIKTNENSNNTANESKKVNIDNDVKENPIINKEMDTDTHREKISDEEIEKEFEKLKQSNSTMKRKTEIIRIISRVLSIMGLFILGAFSYMLFKANVLPNKYFIIIVGIFAFLEILYLFFSFKKKTKKKLLVFLDIFAVLIFLVQLFGIFKINETLDFLNKNLTLKYDTNTYYVVVNKDSAYKDIKDIENQILYGYKDLEDQSVLERNIKKLVNVKIQYEENVVSLMDSVIKDKSKVILLNSGNYDIKLDIDQNYAKKTRILKEIKLKTKTKENKSSIDVTEDPFVVYLSGIDTRSGGMPVNSLSDVNMVVVVNPNTNKILLVSIPRDYYVKLHGITGLNDKLTHAGSLGGVRLSKATIEDLLNQKIDFYVRVNFNSVINLVDAIGGINLYSDVDYPFTCWTDSGCSFSPGNNYVKGRCALAFARERYAYDSGDRHRGENQQQVIKQILNKVTSSSTIIKNYSNILNSLSGTFESSLSTRDITSLVKYQINEMPKWKIENVNLDGTTGMTYTYSAPSTKLSVMYPNEKTIENAKLKIKEVLNEE